MTPASRFKQNIMPGLLLLIVLLASSCAAQRPTLEDRCWSLAMRRSITGALQSAAYAAGAGGALAAIPAEDAKLKMGLTAGAAGAAVLGAAASFLYDDAGDQRAVLGCDDLTTSSTSSTSR